MLNSRHNRGDRVPSLQRFMRVWSLQHSLCQPLPRMRRLCQHQVHSNPNSLVQSPTLMSCSIALYGLILFYGLTKEELVGRRPLAKFLSIKLIVMFTFYQSFVVCLLFSP